jgi:hypothetical protein
MDQAGARRCRPWLLSEVAGCSFPNGCLFFFFWILVSRADQSRISIADKRFAAKVKSFRRPRFAGVDGLRDRVWTDSLIF